MIGCNKDVCMYVWMDYVCVYVFMYVRYLAPVMFVVDEGKEELHFLAWRMLKK
jgi:hypothetical protein